MSDLTDKQKVIREKLIKLFERTHGSMQTLQKKEVKEVEDYEFFVSECAFFIASLSVTLMNEFFTKETEQAYYLSNVLARIEVMMKNLKK